MKTFPAIDEYVNSGGLWLDCYRPCGNVFCALCECKVQILTRGGVKSKVQYHGSDKQWYLLYKGLDYGNGESEHRNSRNHAISATSPCFYVE